MQNIFIILDCVWGVSTSVQIFGAGLKLRRSIRVRSNRRGEALQYLPVLVDGLLGRIVLAQVGKMFVGDRAEGVLRGRGQATSCWPCHPT